MGSTAGMILTVFGLAAPALVALVLIWNQERRRDVLRTKFGRMAQDNRGLKLAMNKQPAGALPLAFSSDEEREEFLELAGTLAANGTLLDWLRLGTKPPLDAGARLLGVNERDAIALRQAVSDWTAQGILAVLDRVKVRFTNIADMERVWTASVGDVNLRPVLDQSMWIFEPDVVVTEAGHAVSTTATLARAVTDLSLDPSRSTQDSGGRIFVDLRDVRATVGSEDQLQAWSDVRELIKAGAIRERDSVDVYVIGGSVDDLDGNPRIEGRNRNVRITSVDYNQMIGRAKRLTLGLYDDLQDAPFLRQYRADAEEAAAAEIEGQRQAQMTHRASEEEPDLRRGEGDDESIVRHVDEETEALDGDTGHDAPEHTHGDEHIHAHDDHSHGEQPRDDRGRFTGHAPAPTHVVHAAPNHVPPVLPPAPKKPPRRFLRNAAQ
jgi:hypothetical protein